MTRIFIPIVFASAIMAFLVIPLITEDISGLEASNLHWSPEHVIEDEPVTIFILISNITAEELLSVHLIVDEINLTMIQWPEETNSSIDGIFRVEHEFADPGSYNASVVIMSDSESFTSYAGSIQVGEGRDKDDATIFGLPRWWCSVSIIIATGIFIFITWAYFKGRKLQIQKEMETGISESQCSECGKEVSHDADECPNCGADLSEVEFVCGKCGKIVPSSSSKCLHCGTKLHEMGNGGDAPADKSKRGKRSDPDMKKLRGRISMEGKVECYECGCIYLGKESSCPECGSKRKRNISRAKFKS